MKLPHILRGIANLASGVIGWVIFWCIANVWDSFGSSTQVVWGLYYGILAFVVPVYYFIVGISHNVAGFREWIKNCVGRAFQGCTQTSKNWISTQFQRLRDLIVSKFESQDEKLNRSLSDLVTDLKQHITDSDKLNILHMQQVLHAQINKQLIEYDKIVDDDGPVVLSRGKPRRAKYFGRRTDGETVAVKQLPKDTSVLENATQLQALVHPNLVQYFAFLQDGIKGRFSVVMEWCPRYVFCL